MKTQFQGLHLFLAMTAALLSPLLYPAGAQGEVAVWEDALTLPTYPWFDDSHPVFRAYEKDIYYPYSRQDHIGKSSQPRTYRTLCLENEYLRVVCIPELGGRIHSVLVKATGEEMFHRNDEIKPALIAMRGGWISGGIEWNAGPHGHTVTILSPVDAVARKHVDGSVTLTVGNTEKMFRTRWTVRITLHPNKAYLDEVISIYNPTDVVAPYYFWNCTAFPNLEGTRFIYPMTLGTDHNGREFFRWPVHEGRDISWLKNYDTMSSVFGYKCEFDFFGAYDAALDKGIVSYANHRELPGKKAWTWGKDDFGIVSQMALSDAGPVHAQYIEVQSGPLLTQSDYGMLLPGREVRWREFWYPVHGLGDGFEYATRDAAVQTTRRDGVLEVRALATAPYPGARCIIKQAGRALFEKQDRLGPEGAVAFVLENAPEGPLEIELVAADETTLLRYVSPLDIPVVDPPDLKETIAREDGRLTPDELYAKAFLLHSQTNPDAAKEAYLAVLKEDPLHSGALCGLADLALGIADWSAARDYAAKALLRDDSKGDAWLALGAAQLRLGENEAARASGYKAAYSLDALGRGFHLAGRAAMRLGLYDDGLHAFERARAANPLDGAVRNAWLAAQLAGGDLRDTARLAKREIVEDPTDFTLRVIAALAADEVDAFTASLASESGEVLFTGQEAACFLMDLGLHAQASTVFEALLSQVKDEPMTRYYAAWCRSLAGDEDAAGVHLIQAETLSAEDVFPARFEALSALEYAASVRPNYANTQLLLGHVLAHFGRLEAAAACWRKAVELDAGQGVVWRLLALHAWKKDNNIEEAHRCLQQALAVRPEDQIVYRDLARILEELDRREEGIVLIEGMPRNRDVRYDVYLWLAEAYLREERWDDCIALLETARFSNWEGHTKPHDLFASALMSRGKAAFAAGRAEDALADFERALTYPENLEVGASYIVADAETRYWLGKALLALGRRDEAREAWKNGAEQRTLKDPPLPFVRISETQDAHVRQCIAALEVLAADDAVQTTTP